VRSLAESWVIVLANNRIIDAETRRVINQASILVTQRSKNATKFETIGKQGLAYLTGIVTFQKG